MADKPYEAAPEARQPLTAPTIRWSDVLVAIPLTVVAQIVLSTLLIFIPYLEQFRMELFMSISEQYGDRLGLVQLTLMLMLYRVPSLIFLFCIFCAVLHWVSQRRQQREAKWKTVRET